MGQLPSPPKPPPRFAAFARAALGEGSGRRGTTILVATLGVFLSGLAAFAISACDGQNGTKGPSSSAFPPPPEPLVPERHKIKADAGPTPRWIRRLNPVKPPAKPGDRVWALTPTLGTEMASVGLFKVHAVDGTTATLVDQLSQKITGIPGAVIHPLNKTAPRVGELALCFTLTMPAALARVASKDKDDIRVQYDLAGTTKQTVVTHAEPAVKGIAPLAYVGFPKAGKMSKGLVAALSESHGWILTGSGHIEVHPTKSLTALKLSRGQLRKGAPVLAYSWVGGFEKGTVSQVLESGLRYAVDLGKVRGEQRYFFTDLIPDR